MSVIAGILAGTVGNGILGAIQSSVDYSRQQKLMLRQYLYQKDMWNYTFDKQNQYNLPSEQLARLKQAGLNPNLAYGQVHSAGQSGHPGSLPNAKPNPLNLGQIDMASLLNAETNRAGVDSQVDYNKAKTQGQLIENAFNAHRYGGENGNRLAEALLRQAESQADLTAFQADKTSVERNNEVIKSAMLVAQERNINAQIALYIAQAATEGVKPSFIYKQMQDIDSKISERDANIAYISVMKDLVGEQKQFQYLKNINFDKMNDHELAKIASEVYKNYFVHNSVLGGVHLNNWLKHDVDKKGHIKN